MNTISNTLLATSPLVGRSLSPETIAPQKDADPKNEELREVFHDFVGESFFGQMLAAMRKTVGKPAYFHGGRGEEVFQGQLDQILAERMSDATAKTFSEPMLELMMLPRH